MNLLCFRKLSPIIFGAMLLIAWMISLIILNQHPAINWQAKRKQNTCNYFLGNANQKFLIDGYFPSAAIRRLWSVFLKLPSKSPKDSLLQWLSRPQSTGCGCRDWSCSNSHFSTVDVWQSWPCGISLLHISLGIFLNGAIYWYWEAERITRIRTTRTSG